ncbi:MAG: hypothetical protein ABI140_07570 [Jatrophihabitantaceae bacterium]
MTVPSVFGLPHLSEDAVAAFADGFLSPQAAARARRHCAECTECSEAVRGQREAAMMLRAASAPSLPAGLLDRLAGLPMSAPLPDRRSGLPTGLDPNGVPMFIAHQPPAKAAGLTADRTSLPTAMPAAEPATEPTRSSHRRVLFPVSILASAAAVVAAGTLGGSASSFQPTLEQPAAVNLAPNLIGNSGGSGQGLAGSSSGGFAAAGFEPAASWPVSQLAVRPAVATSRPQPAP